VVPAPPAKPRCPAKRPNMEQVCPGRSALDCTVPPAPPNIHQDRRVAVVPVRLTHQRRHRLRAQAPPPTGPGDPPGDLADRVVHPIPAGSRGEAVPAGDTSVELVGQPDGHVCRGNQRVQIGRQLPNKRSRDRFGVCSQRSSSLVGLPQRGPRPLSRLPDRPCPLFHPKVSVLMPWPSVTNVSISFKLSPQAL
jgi:hypothetical protein